MIVSCPLDIYFMVELRDKDSRRDGYSFVQEEAHLRSEWSKDRKYFKITAAFPSSGNYFIVLFSSYGVKRTYDLTMQHQISVKPSTTSIEIGRFPKQFGSLVLHRHTLITPLNGVLSGETDETFEITKGDAVRMSLLIGKTSDTPLKLSGNIRLPKSDTIVIVAIYNEKSRTSDSVV
eukprot:TRINITY_DN2523_c0_g3_i5.p1 TRINITY_DN2523_c0_g3~~TRINITY_DN2523_c0_g3_i5.p1  ORF type:complete len:177 (+),score=21.17 TRINITY_DN2523_c0_g3_i5:262-792(+)